jgi:hypothetical protein
MHMIADFLGSNSGETPATAASASATATAASSPTVKQSPKRLITNLKDFSRLAKSGSHDDKSEACNTTMWRQLYQTFFFVIVQCLSGASNISLIQLIVTHNKIFTEWGRHGSREH